MLKELLKKRNVKSFSDFNQDNWPLAKKELLNTLCNEEYGFLPPAPIKTTWEEIERNENFCAGKATLKKILIKCLTENGEFTFPIYSAIPNGNFKHPFFIHISFKENVPNEYLPSEEICDNGFGVLSFWYKDITSDSGDFNNGLAKVIYKEAERSENQCGKIGLWSWAASRVMDYTESLSNLDLSNAAIIGHSRLGKTALLTGALDDRFNYVISNNSGCSGAALARGNAGEKIKDIYETFPYWFCKNYEKYIDNEDNMPFDQHFLLSAIAPRKVYVASAKEDLWADPVSEYLACVAASETYEKLGLKGFVHPDRLPEAGDVFHEGNIGYHLRAGKHYLSREDWNYYMNYIKLNIGR